MHAALTWPACPSIRKRDPHRAEPTPQSLLRPFRRKAFSPSHQTKDTEMTNTLSPTRQPLWKRIAAGAFVVLAGYGAGNIAAKIVMFSGSAA